MAVGNWAKNWLRSAKMTTLAFAAALTLLGAPSGALSAGVSSAQSDQQIGPKVVVIPVEGMVCISCAATVKRAIKKMDGVSDVEVSLEDRTARVTYMPAKVSPERITAVIDKLGYKAGAPREAQ